MKLLQFTEHNGGITVSYTHLDVYKRQMVLHTAYCVKRFPLLYTNQ